MSSCWVSFWKLQGTGALLLIINFPLVRFTLLIMFCSDLLLGHFPISDFSCHMWKLIKWPFSLGSYCSSVLLIMEVILFCVKSLWHFPNCKQIGGEKKREGRLILHFCRLSYWGVTDTMCSNNTTSPCAGAWNYSSSWCESLETFFLSLSVVTLLLQGRLGWWYQRVEWVLTNLLSSLLSSFSLIFLTKRVKGWN